jgi:uncharacterized Zn-binding protein involved in type VI secretion/predicted TIM-barrel fold metal-dependent hydrolase
MPPSARITDNHTCPIHGAGPISIGEPTVLVGSVPAARLGDGMICPCGVDLIAQGEPTVLFGSMQASRIGDATAHGGAIVQGCPTVLIGSTAQTEALKTDKPFCEQCERLKPKEVPVDRPVLMDAHMHIQSGNCAPLPPIRDRIPIFNPDRDTLNWLGGTWVAHQWLTGDLGDMSPLTTANIGRELIGENDRLGEYMWQVKSPYFLGMSIVLTMDMDYVHLDGYDGLHIYQEDADGRRFYYKRTDGTTPREQLKKKYLGELEDMPMDVEEGEDAARMRRESADLDRYLADKDANCYETWRQQRSRTDRATVRDPLRFFPMYHYEPRRYIKDEDKAAPFDRLVEKGGLYVGFKMYTSQGYMPDENTKMGEKTRDVTRYFFKRCAGEDVPIMTHCTPGGWYTHHRPLMIDLAEPAEREKYVHPISHRLDDTGRMRYFQEHFVHPDAWRPALELNPGQRLCLAHWASDSSLWCDSVADFEKPVYTDEMWTEIHRWQRSRNGRENFKAKHLREWAREQHKDTHALPSLDDSKILYRRSWIRAAVEACKDFPNVYTDISYLPLREHAEPWDGSGKREYWQTVADVLRKFPHMLDKIMYGTDWYMILADKYTYRGWHQKTAYGLRRIQESLPGYSGPPLFWRFSILNPLKFYRMAKIADKLIATLESKVGALEGDEKNLASQALEARKTILKEILADPPPQAKQELFMRGVDFLLEAEQG